MTKVNWKIRFKNKAFLSSLIALLLVLTNQISYLFGYDLTIISEDITDITETILIILGLIGVINDPTTMNGLLGLSDSEMANRYKLPRKDK